MFVATFLVFSFLLISMGIMNELGGRDTPDPTANPAELESDKPKLYVKEEAAAAKQLRFNKQCFLLQRLRSLMKLGATRPGRLKWFSSVTGPPMEITNALVAKKNIGPLFGLGVHQHALLQPGIRLFIVKKNSKGKDVEIELPFAADLGAGTTKHSIDDLVKDANYRGQGAGIKSFSYDLAGVNPAEAEKLIEAKMVLYFKSIGDLFAHRAKGPRGESISYADLINYSERLGKAARKNTVRQPKDFRIKAVVGWAEPQLHDRKIINEKLLGAINQSSATLFLQLINHSITFGQDGTIEMEIDYMAALDGMVRSSVLDVFWTPEDVVALSLAAQVQGQGMHAAIAIHRQFTDAKRSLQKAEHENLDQKKVWKILDDHLGPNWGDLKGFERQGRLLDKKMTASLAIDVINREIEGKDDLPFVDGTWRGQNEQLQIQIKKSTEDAKLLEEIRARKRTAIYKRIIDALLGTKGKKGYLYYTEASQYDVGLYGAESGIASAEIILNGRKREKEAPSVTADEVKPASKDEAASKGAKLHEAATAGQKGERVAVSKIDFASEIKTATENDGNLKIYFFYFGDLIDILLDILRGGVTLPGDSKVYHNKEARATLDDFNILMGPVIIKEKTKSGEIPQKYIGNIADLPISFDLFEDWFTEKVIKTQRPAYRFKSIMRDLMSDLITPAMGSGCFASEKQEVKISSIPIIAPAAAGDKSKIPKYGARCGVVDIRKGQKQQSPMGRKNIAKLTNYLYFFMVDKSESDREVDEAYDTSKGIYHLRVGADKGLVKSIEFNQEDIPFLKESRITNDAETKDGFLRAKYDASIKLVGNSFFVPGQYIYVHPTVPGYKSLKHGKTENHRSLLRKIGLGGYFLVTKVFHMISPEYYQTDMTAMWESFGVTKGEINAGLANVIPAQIIKRSVGNCAMNATMPEADPTRVLSEEDDKEDSALTAGKDTLISKILYLGGGDDPILKARAQKIAGYIDQGEYSAAGTLMAEGVEEDYTRVKDKYGKILDKEGPLGVLEALDDSVSKFFGYNALQDDAKGTEEPIKDASPDDREPSGSDNEGN